MKIIPPSNNEDFMEKIKNFYHKFNKYWCGSDFPYDLCKYDGILHVNDWFEPVRIKRGQNEHRYIFMMCYCSEEKYKNLFKCTCTIKNSLEKGCRGCFSHFYANNMPDARGIKHLPMTDDLKATFFRDKCLFIQGPDTFPNIKKWTLHSSTDREFWSWDKADNEQDVEDYKKKTPPINAIT